MQLSSAALASLTILGAVSLAACQETTPEQLKALAARLPARATGLGPQASDRAAWAKIAAEPRFADVVARGERVLQTPLPAQPDDLYLEYSRNGNRTNWQRVANQRRGRITELALAECVEGKGRFLPALEETLRAVCAEPTWVMPAHDGNLQNFRGQSVDIDLGSSMLAWNLATARWLLAGRLSPEVDKLVLDNCQRRINTPYRDMIEGRRGRNWWLTTTNNWNAVCLAGVTGTALATLDDRADRALFVDAATRYVRNFLKGFTPDGYCSEGVGYWNYGFGYFVLLSDTLWRATDGQVDLLRWPEAKAPATFGPQIIIQQGVCPAFADCSVNSRPSSTIVNYVTRLLSLGRLTDEEVFARPGGSLYETMIHALPNAATATPMSEQAVASAGLRSWFPDAGILVARPADGARDALGAALKGGHNAEHHNHNDIGSYTIVVGNRPVLLDPGAETYTARTFSSRRYDSKLLNSYGHPVPVVAGKLQRTGREAAAKVLQTEFTPARDTLQLDLKAGYDVPELQSLVRTFEYDRAGQGRLTVTDEVVFTSPQTFGSALLTLGDWRREADGSLLIYDYDQAVKVTLEAAGGELEIQAEEIRENAPVQPTRLGLNFTRPLTRALLKLTIVPHTLDLGGDGLLRNGGFEYGRLGWSVGGSTQGEISAEQAASGKYSLKITDDARDRGSNITSASFPSGGHRKFEWRGKVRYASGEGIGMYVYFLDADGERLNRPDANGNLAPVGTLAKAAPGQWVDFALPFEAPEGTASLALWIHSFNASLVTAWLDDLEIVPLD